MALPQEAELQHWQQRRSKLLMYLSIPHRQQWPASCAWLALTNTDALAILLRELPAALNCSCLSLKHPSHHFYAFASSKISKILLKGPVIYETLHMRVSGNGVTALVFSEPPNALISSAIRVSMKTAPLNWKCRSDGDNKMLQAPTYYTSRLVTPRSVRRAQKTFKHPSKHASTRMEVVFLIHRSSADAPSAQATEGSVPAPDAYPGLRWARRRPSHLEMPRPGTEHKWQYFEA